MLFINQPYHLVEKRAWALIRRLNVFNIVRGFIIIFCFYFYSLFFLGILGVSIRAYQWWRDIRREGSVQGHHKKIVIEGLYISMVFFIVSEVFFFFSFFWGYFHNRLARNRELGFLWPPTSLVRFNPYSIPLLNRLVLLSSGVTVTWVHHSVLEGSINNMFYGFILTLSLGGYFTFLQLLEYEERFFCLSDSVYGSIFFLATGFHGLHVLVGSLYLLISFIRGYKGQYTSEHNLGIELAIWYWHFVDVVWLFLYIFIYWLWF